MLAVSASRRMSKRANPDPVVLIRSSAYASLPAPGNRVGTGDASNMPVIQASTGNSAIKTADGAHHYRLLGLQIKAPTTLLQGAAITIGGGETTLAEFPTDITIDRCIVRGDATVGLRRGIQLDGIRCAVIDSYIYDVGENGADSQAVWAYNTPGPLKIVNNYLEGAGENLMFGGASPTYTDSLPRDVEIRRNYIAKNAAWQGVSTWDVKNLTELKLGERVLFEGNVFANHWQDAQNTFAIVLTPRNESGSATWAVVQDITLRYNKITASKSGIQISGTDTNYSSQDTHRITVQDNLFELSDTGAGGDERALQMVSGPDEVQFLNNTFIFTQSSGTVGYLATLPKAQTPLWRNNVFIQRSYGIIGDGAGEGTAAFNAFCDSYTYSYNMLVGGTSGSYPGSSGNIFPVTVTAAKFTNYAGGDYSLASDSPGHNAGSDSTDMGADFTALASMTQYTVTGQWGSEPATYADHTYTNAELPRSYVDTTFATPSGTEWICTTAAEFTTALAGCAVGDIITLTAGNTFTGSFTLRNI